MLEMKNKMLEMEKIYIFETLSPTRIVYYKGELWALW